MEGNTTRMRIDSIEGSLRLGFRWLRVIAATHPLRKKASMAMSKKFQQIQALCVDLPVAKIEAVIELAWMDRARLQQRWRGLVSPDVHAGAARTYTGRFPNTSVEDYIAALPRSVQQGLLALMLFGRDRGRTSVREMTSIKHSPHRGVNIPEYLASKSKLGEYLEWSMMNLEL